ncbi:MAG: hypothetical protein EXR77_14830 [Myxococcales bacterium]|nr:hypothetical protein [Myxococcales bacterium]
MIDNWLSATGRALFGADCAGCGRALPVGNAALWCACCTVAVILAPRQPSALGDLVVTAHYVYTGPVADWLVRAKLTGAQPRLDGLDGGWRAQMATLTQGRRCVAVPIGPHAGRLTERGWHLPDLLANLTAPLPIWRGLRRTDCGATRRVDRQTLPQFSVRTWGWPQRPRLPIVLIDDVITSGATVAAAAATLRAAGLTVIAAMCLADARPQAIAHALEMAGSCRAERA